MKSSFRNTFPLDKKYLSLAGVSEKWKKITSTSQKLVSTGRNKVYYSRISKSSTELWIKQYCIYWTENPFRLAGMKNSLKKRFSREKLLSLSGISDKWKKRFFACDKNSCCWKQWGFLVKIAFRIISVMVTTSKNNTIILNNTISPRQKRVLQLLFPLVETVIEFTKNPIF